MTVGRNEPRERIASKLREDEDLAPILRASLGEASPLLPFAEAVIVHVAGAEATAEDRAETTAEVLRVLHLVEEEDEATPTRLLLGHPALLASFFQNADLLEHGSPEATRVGRLVMSALEHHEVTGR